MIGGEPNRSHRRSAADCFLLLLRLPERHPPGICSARSACGARYEAPTLATHHGRERSMVQIPVNRWYAVLVMSAALLGAVPAGAAAQELYGSVVGSVQDNSGAVIPGASVQLTNRENNLVLTTVSNDTGAYTFTNV